jgi:prepilin signal peptidase PulO-like enzyme (type II secretory pathway)
MKTKLNVLFAVISTMIFVAAMSRLLPHPPNFAPIGGMALFGAAYYVAPQR